MLIHIHHNIWQFWCFSEVENLHSASILFHHRERDQSIQTILTSYLMNAIPGQSGCWNPLILLYVTLSMLSPCCCIPLQFWGSKSSLRVITQEWCNLVCWALCQHVLCLHVFNIGGKWLRKVLIKTFKVLAAMDLFISEAIAKATHLHFQYVILQGFSLWPMLHSVYQWVQCP